MPVLKQGTRKKSVTTTDDDGQKNTPPNRGRSIFILVLFYWFWTHVKFFRGSRKRFSTNCLLFRMINRNSQISSFESYTFLRRIQNKNQLDVGIHFFCRLGLIFVLKKNNFFFHFNRTPEPDQSILIYPFFFIKSCIPCCPISRSEKIIINRKTRRLIFDPRTVYKGKNYHQFPHSKNVFRIKI